MSNLAKTFLSVHPLYFPCFKALDYRADLLMLYFTITRFQPFQVAEICHFHCILNVSYVSSLHGFWNLVKSRYVKLECISWNHHTYFCNDKLHFVFFSDIFWGCSNHLSYREMQVHFLFATSCFILSLFHLKFDRHEDFTTVFHHYCHKVKWKKSSLERW